MSHPYSTPQQVQAELPHIRQWGQGVFPSVARIAGMIEQTDNQIDSHLAMRFEVPFDTVPQSVADISRDLTVSNVRALIFSQAPEPDRHGPDLRKRTMEWLTAIAGGTAALDPQGAPQADTVAGDDRRPEGSWESTDEPKFTLADES